MQGTERGMVFWSILAALALASPTEVASSPAGTATKAMADSQCKPGQSAPTGKFSDWKDGLHEEASGLTPATVPGATRVSYEELICLNSVYAGRLVGVTPVKEEQAIPGTWRFYDSWAGTSYDDDSQISAERQLHYSVGTDFDRPVVIYCHNSYCFMSYNLALRAAKAGYRNIYWFRDGMDTWREKGGKLGPIAPAIAALGSDANNMLSCLAWMQSLTVVGAGKTSNYLPFGKRLMGQLQTNIPAHTVAEALSDYMDFQAVDEIEMYGDLLKRNRTEAAAFRKAHLADLDKTCRALPGAPSALFSS